MIDAGPPQVTICIANYNGEHMLQECIDSVLAQDTEAEVEIIVHDDASTDGSLALIGNRYPGVHVLASPDNVGFCIANNRMVDVASGKYILLLNNDAALHPDALRSLLEHGRQCGEPAILTLPQYDRETDALVDRGCLLDPFHVPVPNLDAARNEVAYVIGACLWIPRDVWYQLGGFPEWFGSIAEDMYLCCAARLRGIPVRCLEGSGYRHRQGASFGGNRAGQEGLRTRYRRRYLSERNRLAVLFSCVPTLAVWPWLAMHTMSLVVEGAALTMLKGSIRIWREIYWASLRDAWNARSHLVSLRNAVMASNKVGLRRFLHPYRLMPRKLILMIAHGLPKFS